MLIHYLIILFVASGAVLAGLFLYRKWKKVVKHFEDQNQELAAMNQSKSLLIHIMAHDLKNQLGSLRMVTSAFSEKRPQLADAAQWQYLDTISQSAAQTYRLLEDLLHWASLEDGKIKVNPELIDIKDLVMEESRVLQPVMMMKGLSLHTEITSDCAVTADRRMIASVVRNLLFNAVMHADKPGKIKLTTFVNGPETMISVSDEGPGIKPEILGRLFRYVPDRSTGANGLGLFLCKEFVEKNGGKISAESEPGNGSIFTFTLRNQGG
jgi:signal transduction histidine kinase